MIATSYVKRSGVGQPIKFLVVDGPATVYKKFA